MPLLHNWHNPCHPCNILFFSWQVVEHLLSWKVVVTKVSMDDESCKKLTFWKWMISLCNLVSRAQKWRKIAQKIQILYFCSRNTVNHLCMQWLPVIITRGSVQFNVIVSQPWDLGMDYVQINVQEKVKTNPLIYVSREIHFPQFWCRQFWPRLT